MVCADERDGIRQFQELAEILASRFEISRLQALVDDVNTYRPPLEQPNSRLWLKYYGAWLKHQAGLYSEAEQIYQDLAENKQAEPKLQAYAGCDRGAILARWNSLKQDGGPARAIHVLETALGLHDIDYKLALGYVALRSVFAFLGEWKKAAERLERAREFMEKQGDTSGLLLVLDRVKADHGLRGVWREMFAVQREALEKLPADLEGSFVHARLLGTYAEGWIYAGRYFDAENNLRLAIRFSENRKGS